MQFSRFYSSPNFEIADPIESLTSLGREKQCSKDDKRFAKNGFDYCRTCYRHLAGYVGVTIVEAMEEHGYFKKSDSIYIITKKGWEWLSQFDIWESDYKKSHRPLTRQRLDRSERLPHLAG